MRALPVGHTRESSLTSPAVAGERPKRVGGRPIGHTQKETRRRGDFPIIFPYIRFRPAVLHIRAYFPCLVADSTDPSCTAAAK